MILVGVHEINCVQCKSNSSCSYMILVGVHEINLLVGYSKYIF